MGLARGCNKVETGICKIKRRDSSNKQAGKGRIKAETNVGMNLGTMIRLLTKKMGHVRRIP
jgi:hypothetical protein